jgi:hypothetical protein
MLGAMTDKPRYQMRANSVALTHFQWWIVGIATLVAAVGFVLLLSGNATGAILMSLSSLIGISTIVIAGGPGHSE